MPPNRKVPPLIQPLTRNGEDGVHFNFHPGQAMAMNSKKRIVLVLAGARGGKSSVSVVWLLREIARRGQGDYLVAAPNYTLLNKAMMPEMEYLYDSMLNLGKLMHSPPEFRFSEDGARQLFGKRPTRPTRIIFGHADKPNSLEAMTAKAAVLDEAGQSQFKIGSWEAIQRRLALDEGRCLIVTTPYCYDQETEIRTRHGWKSFGDLTPTDEVVACIPTGEAHYEKPSRIIWEPYQGPMVALMGVGIDLLVTPDHRVLYRDRGEMRTCEARDFASMVHRDLSIPKTIGLSDLWPSEAGLVEESAEVAYSGHIGCVTVSTGYVLVRRNGEECISGNCLGWLKDKIFDPWEKSHGKHPEIDVVNFDSRANPAFPKEEYDRAERDLPRWKFNMFYRGIFERPAGIIYDSFDKAKHVIPRFKIPEWWKEKYLGLDFGGVNTAAVFYVRDPYKGTLYLYDTYKAGGRTSAEHVAAIKAKEPDEFRACVGGSLSEGQWRAEFGAAGLTIREPAVKEIEVGIDRVYGFHRADKVQVFDDLDGYLDEKLTYSRQVDDNGNVSEKIEDQHAFHYIDAERYILGWLHSFDGEVPMPMSLETRAW